MPNTLLIIFCVEIAQKCENEMLLTRLILKSIIEFLSCTKNLKITGLLNEE